MEDFFGINKLLMNPIGVWPLPNEISLENKKKVIIMLFVIAHSIVVVGQTMAAFKLITYNLVDFTEEVSMLLISFMNIVKCLGFLFQRQLFRDILAEADNLSRKTPISCEDKYIKDVTELWQKRAHLLVKATIILYIISDFIYSLLPLVYYLKDNKFVLITTVDFHIDLTTKISNFLITYTLMFIFFFFNAIVLASMDSWYAVNIIFICTRIDVLNYCIQISINEAAEEGGKTELFGRSVEYHKTLLRVTDMFAKLYSPILLFQFFSSLIMICMSLFVTTQPYIEDMKKMSLGIFFFAACLQLYLFCYFGQYLQTKFEVLNTEAMYSYWYNTPVQFQKDVLFYIMRTSTQVKLTAYELMPVNLESYYIICKTAMSYLVFLQEIVEDIK